MLAAAAAALLAGAAGAGEVDRDAYVGSERCAACHRDKYDGWKDTFHATVVRDARKDPSAILGDFSAPDLGFTLEDVEYTIGGHRDQRYMTRIGDEYYVLPKLWNVQAQSWRPYNVWSWKKKPYGRFCKGCHVTGFDPTTGADAAEHRVGCEACHGAGRTHAASQAAAAIVNPARLPDERREMVCAACHVRGRDLTGTYYFPVGFVPGDDLGDHYVPLDKGPDESNSEAIVRNFQKWKEQRSGNAKVRCEVCGIYGSPEKKGDEAADAMAFCFGCHEFQDKYAEHTRHPAGKEPVCFDCHVQQTKDLMNAQDQDIHSYGYFLVHADNCYDRRIEKTCTASCHGDRDFEWARRVVDSWRGSGPTSH
ncbi:MAG: hypothetical protein Kow0092_06290 [Deferrisomatales bacterium]